MKNGNHLFFRNICFEKDKLTTSGSDVGNEGLKVRGTLGHRGSIELQYRLNVIMGIYRKSSFDFREQRSNVTRGYMLKLDEEFIMQRESD